MKTKNIFYGKKAIHIISFIFLLLILLSIMFVLSTTVYAELTNRLCIEESMARFSKLNSKNIFSIDKILMFSSASSENNEVVNKALWDINISQYTDIAIYINNNAENGLTSENTINSLYIDNVNFFESPSLGTPNLCYKNVNNFGKYEYNPDNIITDALHFEVVNDNIDYEKPQSYIDVSSPICLTYINKNIKENTILSDISNPLIYDGSLLKRANIALGNISAGVSFDIHIINNLNQHFICNASINIPLSSDTSSIYDGYIKQELHNNTAFYRIK